MIEAEVVVTLASVSVADDYRVELVQGKRRMFYTWSEAEQLAAELAAAVVEARRMLAADHPVVVHGFDKSLQLEWVAAYPGRRVVVWAQTRKEASEIAFEAHGTYPDDVWQSRTVLP